MSFQDKISMTMSKVLNQPEYKIPYTNLKERANIKVMEVRFKQNQRETEDLVK